MAMNPAHGVSAGDARGPRGGEGTRPGTRLEIEIGAVVVHGLSLRDSGGLREAFQMEMERLFLARAWEPPRAALEIDRLVARGLALPRGGQGAGTGARAGAAVARAVFAALTRSGVLGGGES